MAEPKPLRLLLGFDYGTKQIGVAVGQAVTGQARELKVLKAQNGVPDWQQVEALIQEILDTPEKEFRALTLDDLQRRTLRPDREDPLSPVAREQVALLACGQVEGPTEGLHRLR